MGREFVSNDRVQALRSGGQVYLQAAARPLEDKDIPAFIEWLQEGPPKKWRITREFDFKPNEASDTRFPRHQALTDADVEVVG